MVDKKNLFNKGMNRCVFYNFYKRHNVSFEKFKSMKCVGKYGKCKKPLIKMNCKLTKEIVIKMSKEKKSFIEIQKYINKNMF